MNAQLPHARRTRAGVSSIWVDTSMMWLFFALCLFGLLMVTSASMGFAESRYGDPLYFLKRQSFFMLIALLVAVVVYLRPSDSWFRHSPALLGASIALLIVVLIPDIGKEVNGSRRWLDFQAFTVQPSEAVKLVVVIFLADYIARRREEVRATFRGFFKPLGVVLLLALLVLLEPDYGVAVILVGVALALLFLAGAKIWQSLLLLVAGAGLAACAVVAAPYRWERVKTFLDPWSVQFESGYQLTQSLIAVGSGGWFGKGLGGGIQKLFYLPEAHTDFIFAVIAEELGFVGVGAVVAVYFGILWRCFSIAARAERRGFCAGAFFCYGMGIWIGVQAFVNIAVVMGLLPTKGITLPAVSVGGSSLVMVFAGLAAVQRIHHETCCEDPVLMRRYQLRKHGVGS